MTFPIDHSNERDFDAGWRGEVVVCDIDRTYLYTRFSSFKGISRIPFEFAVDKQDIEGMAALLREARRGPGRRSRHTPLYFLSASPAQLRTVIQRKMLLDGLEYDGTIFKDWLGVLAGLRLRRFKEQLGFKVTALLQLRRRLPAGARLLLLGDDLETDPLAFAVLADALAGRLRGAALRRVLERNGVSPDDAGAIEELTIGAEGGVAGACIRMERHEDPEEFMPFWPHIRFCRGAFQIAASLLEQGSVSAAGVRRVAESLRKRGQGAQALEEHLWEAVHRGLLSPGLAEALREELARRELVATTSELPTPDPMWQAAARDAAGSWTPVSILEQG